MNNITNTAIWEAEEHRLNLWNAYTIMHDHMHEIKPWNKDTLKRTITTFHIYENEKTLIDWIITQKQGEQYYTYTSGIILNPNDKDYTTTGEYETPSPHATQNSNIFSFAPYPTSESLTDIPSDHIIQHILQYIRHCQTPEHLAQFLIACKALQNIIAGENSVPYISIAPINGRIRKNESGPGYYPIYITHNRDDIFPPNTPNIPNQTRIVGMNTTIEEIQAIEKLQHCRLHADNKNILNNVFGPWHHPIIGNNRVMYENGERLSSPKFDQAEAWPTRWGVIPPNWEGSKPFWNPNAYGSQHAWIGLQRSIQQAEQQLRSCIDLTLYTASQSS